MPIPSARAIVTPRVVTFDFHTALVDCEGSLVPIVREACGGDVDAAALSRAWRATWSNRANEPAPDPEILPDHPMRDLAGLLNILPRIKDRAPS